MIRVSTDCGFICFYWLFSICDRTMRDRFLETDPGKKIGKNENKKNAPLLHANSSCAKVEKTSSVSICAVRLFSAVQSRKGKAGKTQLFCLLQTFFTPARVT